MRRVIVYFTITHIGVEIVFFVVDLYVVKAVLNHIIINFGLSWHFTFLSK